MKTIKVSEATPVQLDWLVAKCKGTEIDCFVAGNLWVWETDPLTGERERAVLFRPTRNWAQGGPIKEKHEICSGYKHQLDTDYVPQIDPATRCWARTTAGGHLTYGPTELIATMRCYLTSKLGDEAEVPEELV